MAKKRFTDIEIWDKEWYMELTPKHKCLMRYIFDKCDASGCWKPNWKLASVHIGDKVALTDLSELPKDQYEVLGNGKIFIPDFINFQYGKISKASPAHNPVFIAIEKNNLQNRVFNRVPDTLQEKDKDIEEDKEGEIELEGIIVEKKFICPAMQRIFKANVPSYIVDDKRDFKPLLSIAQFIHKHEKLSGNVLEVNKCIFEIWEKISIWISEDAWYSQKSLSTISNHIQEIINKSKNGSSKSNSKSTSSPSAGREQANRDY